MTAMTPPSRGIARRFRIFGRVLYRFSELQTLSNHGLVS